MEKLKVASLFCGCGGTDVGLLETAGHTKKVIIVYNSLQQNVMVTKSW